MNDEISNKTVIVLITDERYFYKAKRTIIDIRSKGNWKGDIVMITIDFTLNENFKEFYNVIEMKFSNIDKEKIISMIGPNGFSNSDKRELYKLNQWEKIHVFDDSFKKWRRVIFFDAGLRVLDDIKFLLELDFKESFLAPKDGKSYENQSFHTQLCFDKPEMIQMIIDDFGKDILNEIYFLNCIWIYDTNILNIIKKQELLDAMNKYICCRTNEMAIMNLLITFKYRLWKPFPFKNNKTGKIIFDWCELNNTGTNWKDYCYIKYPITISFSDC